MAGVSLLGILGGTAVMVAAQPVGALVELAVVPALAVPAPYGLAAGVGGGFAASPDRPNGLFLAHRNRSGFDIGIGAAETVRR